ncbi:hypothetical protein [Roseovarius indicus]
MSFLARIDFGQVDQDRTHRIMDIFDSEESRDELEGCHKPVEEIT